MQKLLISTLICASLLIGACTTHKPEIQQGNVITDEMTSKLKAGMTKRQVRFVMGTPSIDDPFHPQRWDYIYTLKKSDQSREKRQITLYFEGDELIKIEEH